MKKEKILILGMLVLALTLSLVFAGCATASGGGVLGGTTPTRTYAWAGEDGVYYRLVLPESSNATVNGTYTLILNWHYDGNLSTGTVSGTLDNMRLTPNSGTVITINIIGNTVTVTGEIDGHNMKGGNLVYDEPKIILITGFTYKDPQDSQNYPQDVNFGWLAIAPDPGDLDNQTVAHGIPETEGQTRAFTLISMVDRRSIGPYTGTGEYFVVFFSFTPRDSNRWFARYVYSEDGQNPTLVDMKNQVTTLEWSKFIFVDY